MVQTIQLRRTVLAGFGGCLISVACSDPEAPPDDANRGPMIAPVDTEMANSATAGSSASPASTPSADYPEGPYATQNPEPGSVVENLRFRGLFNPDAASPSKELPVGDYDLQSFRELGRTHLLLTTAAGWCPSCQQAASDFGVALEQRVHQVNTAGGIVVNLLLEGLGRSLPTDSELTNWATAAELDISVMGAADEQTRAVFPEREWAYILRLDTMQVVWSVEVPLYNDPTVSEIGLDQLELQLNR